MTIDQAIDTAEKLAKAGRTAEGERLLLEVLSHQPRHPVALHLLAIIAGQSGRLDRAITLLQQAIAINPNDVEQRYHLGLALGQRGEYVAAIEAYDAAIALRPDFAEARSNRAITYLLLGDFERGWSEYEWRRKSRFLELGAHIAKPVWTGAPLAGQTILLTAEQGLGDTIQFSRYASMVAARGGRVLLAVQNPLMPVLDHLPGVERLVGPTENSVAFDLHCSLLTLPLIFNTRIDTIPADIPYVRAAPAVVDRWAGRVGPPNGKRRIGLAWAGSPTNSNDQNRSLTAARLAVLGTIPGTEFYSLQVGVAAGQAPAGPAGMRDFSDEIRDFSDTAALISQLDLVISVDTSVVHLAGAMGKPAWVLLPFAPDWRWLLDRTDSPWYPTLRLFRQKSPRQWYDVISEVLQCLGAAS